MARTPFPIRERNRLGGPVDIKNPKWVHQNLQIYGEAIPTIAAAFATDDPFTVLGYPEDPFTRSIEKWSARPCQIDDASGGWFRYQKMLIEKRMSHVGLYP
jgi:hypothetical protein